jgi:hypothetical protein
MFIKGIITLLLEFQQENRFFLKLLQISCPNQIIDNLKNESNFHRRRAQVSSLFYVAYLVLRKLHRQWNRLYTCTPSAYHKIYPPTVEPPIWLQYKRDGINHTYYNVEPIVPLFFDIGRNEVAVVRYDQLFLFNPRTETFSAPVMIPLKGIKWKNFVADYADFYPPAKQGLVQKLIMIDSSRALFGFYESKLEVLMNIDTGHIYDILKIDTLLYLGDNKLLISENYIYLCIFDLNTRTIIAKCDASGMNWQTTAVLLSNNRIAVATTNKTDIFQINEHGIQFIKSKSIICRSDVAVIDDSQIVYYNNGTMFTVDIDLDTEVNCPVGESWAHIWSKSNAHH